MDGDRLSLGGFFLAIALVVLGVAFVLRSHFQDRDAFEDAASLRHTPQEEAWHACVDALGLARCELIESRVADRCLVNGGVYVTTCLEREIVEQN